MDKKGLMRRKDRYDTTGFDETEFEPGSRKRVLKNLLGITSKREMDRLEGQAQVQALEKLVALYDAHHRFTAADYSGPQNSDQAISKIGT